MSYMFLKALNKQIDKLQKVGKGVDTSHIKEEIEILRKTMEVTSSKMVHKSLVTQIRKLEKQMSNEKYAWVSEVLPQMLELRNRVQIIPAFQQKTRTPRKPRDQNTTKGKVGRPKKSPTAV